MDVLDTLTDDKYLKAVFDACSTSPGPWRAQAFDLRWAADGLDWMKGRWGPGSRMGVYLFLLGQSMENLIKGILIAEGQKLFDSKGKPTHILKTHNLVDLAKQIDVASLSLDEVEFDVLDRLTEYVVWAGRYPMPKKADDMRVVATSTPEYFAELDLWGRLFDHLNRVGWWLTPDGRREPFADDFSGQLPERAESFQG